MADAPALGAGAAKAAWRFDPSLAYQDRSMRSDRDILRCHGSPMRTIIHARRTRDLWMVLGLIALAVGLPAIVGIVSGAISIPRNDDFAYRRAATILYETGRLELTGWAVMTLVGQLVATLPFLWLAHGGAWAFAATTATFAIVGIVASYDLARRALSPGRAGFAVLLTILFPGFLLYTTAYMTDVPSFAMEVSCLALGAVAVHRTPEAHRWRWLAASLVVGCYAVSIRELAIAAPVAVLAAAFASDRHRRPLPYAIALIAVVVACAAIYLYARDLPGQGRMDLTMPTPLPIHRVVESMPVVCLALAPALLVGAVTWVPRWWRSRHGLSVALGGLAGAALATLFYRDQLVILMGAASGQDLRVFVGGVFEPHGSLDQGIFAGSRPTLFVAPTWDLLAVLALTATFGALAFLGAALVAERHRLLRAFDFRSLPTPLGSVPGMLAVFVIGFTACVIAAGLFSNVFDRWMWPLALPLAILLLLRPEPGPNVDAEQGPDRFVRSAGRRAGVTVLTGALVAVIAATSLVLLFNAAAFDAARWRMGEEAVRLGFAPETVDAGFEWVGLHAVGVADPAARSLPSMTTYAVKFPSFHQCAVAASSPLDLPGFSLELTRTDAYRLLLFTGPNEPMYLYRVAGSGCPSGP
jgi:Dolichyl-phosphate-mannose-protein mannosyltransferase